MSSILFTLDSRFRGNDNWRKLESYETSGLRQGLALLIGGSNLLNRDMGLTMPVSLL